MTAGEHIVASAWLSLKMWRATAFGLVLGAVIAEFVSVVMSPPPFAVVKEQAVSATVPAGEMLKISVQHKSEREACYISSQRYLDGTDDNGVLLHIGIGVASGIFIDPNMTQVYEIGVLVPYFIPAGHWNYYSVITSHYKFWRFCLPFLESSQRIGNVEIEVLPRSVSVLP